MKFNQRCRIEQKSVTIDPHYGTEIVAWVLFAVRWCNVADVTPSRDESVVNRMAQSSIKTMITLRSGGFLDAPLASPAVRAG